LVRLPGQISPGAAARRSLLADLLAAIGVAALVLLLAAGIGVAGVLALSTLLVLLAWIAIEGMARRLGRRRRAGSATAHDHPRGTGGGDLALAESGGAAGNARLTASVAAALLVLLAAEGATIPFIGSLLGPHVFIGMLLIPPVLLKLGSTGYRFARYYTNDIPYVRRGTPPWGLRLLAPGVVLTTLALFGTGLALLVAGPPSETLAFAHKLSFIAWVALMALHVLGHLLEMPKLALLDWRRSGPPEARLAGAGFRISALGAALLGGIALALLTFSAARPWL
jgi:hypothetical protein